MSRDEKKLVVTSEACRDERARTDRENDATRLVNSSL